MGRRTGLPSMMQIARRLCFLIVAFRPVIQRLYSENTLLLLALDTAAAACAELEKQIIDVLEVGV